MASRAAFRRTNTLLAGRTDVSNHMVKWWGKVRPDDGQVTRHLSPFVQHPVMPWFQTFPKKMMDRAPQYIIYLGGSMFAVYAVVTWGDAADAAEDFKHRF